jgi:hypothetical protein
MSVLPIDHRAWTGSGLEPAETIAEATEALKAIGAWHSV